MHDTGSFVVRRLAAASREDFERIHSDEHGAGWCRCVAWWVASWDGWGERTSGENAALRAALFDRGEHDGYLLYDGDEPIGWCQVGPRDRWTKLARQMELAPDPTAWAVTCFVVVPAARRHGVATALLREVVRDLPSRGARRVEAFPRVDAALDSDAGELWNGAEAMFRAAGFTRVRDVPPRALYALEL